MAIKPVERATLKGQAFGYDDYEVYFADTEGEALKFLKKISVSDNQYYVVVETPGKNVAKDRMGIYNPSRAWRGDDWFSMKWDDKGMEAKQRKHFWKHWSGPFDDIPEIPVPKGKKWWQFWK